MDCLCGSRLVVAWELTAQTQPRPAHTDLWTKQVVASEANQRDAVLGSVADLELYAPA